MSLEADSENATIGVVIPCYNEKPENLSKCLSSIRKVGSWNEIIIIDDASTSKNTTTYLHQASANKEIKLVTHEFNRGPGDARNTGISESDSGWILLIDSDDELLDNAGQELIDRIQKNPDADFFFWDYEICNELGETTLVDTSQICEPGTDRLSGELYAKKNLMHGCACFRKSLWEKLGGYAKELSKGGVEDIDFWRRAVLADAAGVRINQVLYRWNRGPAGVNSNIDEEKYLLHRKRALPFYDRFNPEYGIEMRNYIYRYYSSRLMVKELNQFVNQEHAYFSKTQTLKANLIRFTSFYKIGRIITNWFK